MARLPRTVLANVPHHVTQRGNHGDAVFFRDDDRRAYLAWLREYAALHRVEILAYCLMTNHVHVVAVPADEDGLHRVFKPVHMRYTQRVNRMRNTRGVLWQGRFYSSPLGERYLWAAIRYVERNPVRAGMVGRAQDHPWSSAAFHCGLRADPVLTRSAFWLDAFAGIGDWAAWLGGDDDEEREAVLRRNVERGVACE